MDESRGPGYNIGKLNKIFGISSVILLFTILWMVKSDYTREWKIWQGMFNKIEIEKTEEQIRQTESQIDSTTLVQLHENLKKTEEDLSRRKREYETLQKRLSGLDGKLYKTDQDVRFTKAIRDVLRYEYEEVSRRGSSDAQKKWAELQKVEREIVEHQRRLEELTAEKADIENQVRIFTAQRDSVEDHIAEINKETDRLERKLKRIGSTFVNRFFRNEPLVDFIDPSIKIQQIVINDLYDDVNFATTRKVDRCTTCHMAIDKQGYEDAPHPFRTHPKLNLYLAAGSPHPIDRFGCTICHVGRGRATTFIGTAHTPNSQEQREEWERKHDWEKLEHWDFPMFPKDHAEAACLKCHRNVVEIPHAEQLNRGMRLIRQSGCFGCHKIGGLEGLRRVGPDLRRVSGKLDRGWALKWIKNPKALNPHTKMPRIFDLSNTNSPEDVARNDVAINAVVEYLFTNSESLSYPPPPVSGNASRGRQLVMTLGCRGCHIVGEDDVHDPVNEPYRQFGPDLNRVGSKLSANWLYHWLKDPKQYFPETNMPNLRLSDQEAADMTTYLLTLRDPNVTGHAAPKPNESVLNELAENYLKARMPETEARQRLSAMSVHEKNLFLGERIISRQGCFGCHTIKGFETTMPIGTELTEEGSKDVDRLDFGFIDIDKTREAWFSQKLKEPRIFDRGKVRAYDDKLRMPDFGLTDSEAKAIVTALLAFTKETVLLERMRRLATSEAEVEAGRQIIEKQNCRGCHIINGKGGDIAMSTARTLGKTVEEARAFSPPPLQGEGAKVQPDWLFAFFKGPMPIRPWLSVRMPTFELTDEAANTLIRHFSEADHQVFPYRSLILRKMAREELESSRKLMAKDYLNCFSCHQQGEKKPEGSPEGWAPDFALAPERLKHDWIIEWLKDPQKLQPGTKMPAFFPDEYSGPEDILGGDEHQQIQVMADYLTIGQRQSATTASKR
ncbi:MAG: c-type cytochrome [Candidatus Latescibacteria bacterium]|nr:c-type cytochrome [Candidatus Latescibacterota bacterium]